MKVSLIWDHKKVYNNKEKVAQLSYFFGSNIKDINHVNASHLTFSDASNGQALDHVGLYDTIIKDETLADSSK